MKNQNKPQNPLAFPQDANACLDEYRGMTLRDYFANSVLNGIHSNERMFKEMMLDRGNENPYDYVAKESYRMADAMLKEREKL